MTHAQSSFREGAWLAALGLVAAFTSSLGAAPQDPDGKAAEEVSVDVDWQLWRRGREILHNGDPLHVVGLEEEDNDFRRRTPILEQSDRAIAIIDAEENYRRRLAMYTEEGVFHEPLAASSAMGTGLGPAAVGSTPPLPAPEGQAESGWMPWSIFSMASLALILLLFVRWRRRGGFAR